MKTPKPMNKLSPGEIKHESKLRGLKTDGVMFSKQKSNLEMHRIANPEFDLEAAEQKFKEAQASAKTSAAAATTEAVAIPAITETPTPKPAKEAGEKKDSDIKENPKQENDMSKKAKKKPAAAKKAAKVKKTKPAPVKKAAKKKSTAAPKKEAKPKKAKAAKAKKERTTYKKGAIETIMKMLKEKKTIQRIVDAGYSRSTCYHAEVRLGLKKKGEKKSKKKDGKKK